MMEVLHFDGIEYLSENKKILTHDLLSREAALQVSSAQLCLTSGFGMGPGVSTAVWWVRKNLY